MSTLLHDARNELYVTVSKTKKETISFGKELSVECGSMFHPGYYAEFVKNNYQDWYSVPFLPAFHKPGWMLRYIVGPHNSELFESFFSDFWAGVTVALTLIPQALSYAQLANLPAINGLYTAILPSIFYTFFGSSMQLGVGPVALVSLLMGELVIRYEIDYTNNPDEAIAFAGECAMAVGFLLTAMSLLNLGNLIRYISHPVMSGFTTAAAMLIGMNQLKNAFGFTNSVPQTGQVGYEHNWQVMRWFTLHWNDRNPTLTAAEIASKLSNVGASHTSVRNHYATRICFGLFIPLLIIQIVKNTYKPSKETQKTWAYRIWNIVSALTPFIAIIIGANVAYRLKKSDHFNDPDTIHAYYIKNLKIVGKVTPGLDVIRSPSLKWDFGKVIADVIPLTLVAFLESYSVAQRIATQRNELHILNVSQELWAIGCANFAAAFSSAYPVAGSFSRSSLNAAAGARTPLSKVTTMCVVVLCLRYLTRTFEYIPAAALSAVIWVAIYNLVSFSDFWHAWKYSKKDFLVMIVTAVTVFVAETGTGLAVGIGLSMGMLLYDYAMSPVNQAVVVQRAHEHPSKIDILQLRNDLNFLSIVKVLDTLNEFTLLAPQPPAADASINERVFFAVSQFFDYWLRPKTTAGMAMLPAAVVVDMSYCRVIDLTALHTLSEVARAGREKGVKFVFTNTCESVAAVMTKHKICNDCSSDLVDLQQYLKHSSLKTLPPPEAKSLGSEDADSSEADLEAQVEKAVDYEPVVVEDDTIVLE